MFQIKKIFMNFFQRIFKEKIFKMRSGLAKGLNRRFGNGFKPKFFLSKEEKFLFNLNLKEKTVLDIGGYIGIYSLFFARAVGPKGKVFSFEPNLKNYKELGFNLKLNNFKNTKIFNIAIGEKKSKASLVVPTYSSRGSVSLKVQESFKEPCDSFEVEVESIDNLLKTKLISVPDFVKIDVEGFEQEVLTGMAETISKHKPLLFVEIHGKIKKEILDLFFKNRYSIYHIESNLNINSLNYSEINNGHIYCEFVGHK